jgi:predicted alpha/beta superfamily hydrolase
MKLNRIFFTGFFTAACFFMLSGFHKKKDKDIVELKFYSKQVNDSFDITILLPENYAVKKNYPVVYFLDAGIKSGTHLISHLKEKKNKSVRNRYIFIGIGHTGDFNVLRRRDLIPPKLTDGKPEPGADNMVGHANRFYSFLQKELIPYVEKKYNTTANRSIIGHSFGGLFVYYCLFREERLFQQFFALSPSLWVNNSNIFEYEAAFYKKQKKEPAYLYMANGSLEFANFVLPSNRRMNTLLKKRDYKNLTFYYVEKQFANHNSHVPLTLQEILGILKNKSNK